MTLRVFNGKNKPLTGGQLGIIQMFQIAWDQKWDRKRVGLPPKRTAKEKWKQPMMELDVEAYISTYLLQNALGWMPQKTFNQVVNNLLNMQCALEVSSEQFGTLTQVGKLVAATPIEYEGETYWGITRSPLLRFEDHPTTAKRTPEKKKK